MIRYALAALALVATPAHADSLDRMEVAWQVLNAVDTAQTLDCLDRNVCREGNPLISGVIGRNPDGAKLIAYKAGAGLVHYGLYRLIRSRDEKAARVFQIIGLAVQGGVVAANMRFAF